MSILERTPDLDVDVGDRLAGVHVNDLRVHTKEDTLLLLDVIVSDKLAADIYRTVSHSVVYTDVTPNIQ